MRYTVVMDKFYKNSDELSELLTTLIEHSNDGYWVWDLKDYEYYSPRFKEILGYEDSELENDPSTWMGLIHEDDLQLALENFTKHKADPTYPYYQRVRYYHKNGSIIWVICRGFMIRDENHEPRVMVGVHTDITELKRKKEKIQIQMERAHAATRAKNIFLASMSHEIRTPMNGIIGLLQVLQVKETDRKKNNLLTKISECADDLSTLLDDILDYTKFDAQIISLNKEEFDVRKILDSIIVKFKASHSRIKFKTKYVRVNKNERLLIYNDRLRFIQIMTNIVSNAAKYTPEGSVTVKAKVVDDKVVISVKDTGVGISKENKSKIFKPFYRVEDTSHIRGTGLGLSVCKKLCKTMGGQIKLKSTVGKGTKFTLKFDKSNRGSGTISQTASDSDTSTDTNLPHLKIALVEDNPINVCVMKEILKTLGHSINYTAENGVDIVERVKHEEFDIIFMDDKMPKMTGVEAATIIKESSPGTYIVAQTANAIEGDREKYLKLMDDYISKPISITDLRKCFRTFTKRRYL